MTQPPESGGWMRELLKGLVRGLGKVVLGLVTVLGILIIVLAGLCFYVS